MAKDITDMFFDEFQKHIDAISNEELGQMLRQAMKEAGHKTFIDDDGVEKPLE
jgi:hypothetical protein